MTEDAGVTRLDDHSEFAESLLRILESFADEFADRSVPVHFEEIVNEGKYLKGKLIKQHPERFMEEQLIWPTLRLFDYSIRSQPYGYPRWDNTRPDFAIENFDCKVDCNVIGEIKTPNKLKYAIEDVESYLKSDLGKSTVAFATDGFVWKVYVRPAKADNYRDILEVDLKEVFVQLTLRHTEKETYNKHATRSLLEGVENLRRTLIEESAGDVFDELGRQQ
jgi:hypothetical protein